jgi:hypothetical protein
LAISQPQWKTFNFKKLNVLVIAKDFDPEQYMLESNWLRVAAKWSVFSLLEQPDSNQLL